MVTLRPVVERATAVGGDWHLVLGGHCTVDDADVFLRAGVRAARRRGPAVAGRAGGHVDIPRAELPSLLAGRADDLVAAYRRSFTP